MTFATEVGEDQSDTLFDSGTYTPAGYIHPSSQTVPISMNFYDGAEESEYIEGSNPIAECDDADVSGVIQNAHIGYGLDNYIVKKVEADGTGRTFLHLKKVL